MKAQRPPGPTWITETARPWSEVLQDYGHGLLPIARSRFERFGDIYYATNMALTPLYSTRHPDHVHEILITRGPDFVKRSKDLVAFLGDGIFTSQGAYWRKQRRRIQPAFRRENIARYAEIMADQARSMVDRWVPGEIRDINREMMEVTLAIVAKSLLDYDTTGVNDDVARAMTVIQETVGFPDPLPRWVPTPLHRKQQKAIDELDRIIMPLIDGRTEETRGPDLLSQLKFDGNEDGPLSRQQIRDELVTMFLAGHETTALSLAWTFFLLSNHRDCEAKLHAEIDQVLEGRSPTFEDLDNLPYTRMVVQEGLRMFPPLYLLPRVAVRDTEVGGYPLKAKSEILIWVYFMHRDERWFPDPGRFWPERFVSNSGGVNHPHAYLPFGAGSRACIGRHFAMAESMLVLAVVAQRYKLRLAPGQDVRLHARVTLGPQDPIQMELDERDDL